ncbi:membrane protein [Renibacterium salmoninarum ATCC 33209]|uniref:Membrane protein n=1 Tax=Renibacterium salmoninarum (strain ATCC 33209 / DSM 20767 / JCM 11484 / NBRC 15589 / NCIMB 2235) TaxID=288705 RepID=A9WRZ7_RENSM|nr:PLDc N-terminal domain-containing protein [Renibacterium salmoninarum]ABY24429.1 membrane protein [Renibacterium salmoninarum ATCC 33209]
MLRYLPLLIVVGIQLYALIDCIRSEASHIRSLPKPAWALIIIILPIIGFVLWFFLGRLQYGTASAVRSQPTIVAPDDDAEFLRNLDVTRKQKAEEARLKQLRDELEERERQLRDQDS